MVEILVFPIFILVSLIARFSKRKFDIGIGPLPLINNVYHKKALSLFGWSTETFVNELFYITQEFDVKLHERWRIYPTFIRNYISFFWIIFRYRCLYFYFDGCVLSKTIFLWRFEGLLLRWANIKTVILGYGSDVQEMTRTQNLNFKHVMSLDYPTQPRNRSKIAVLIDSWVKNGSHVIGGCEWVDYMSGWDSLMIAHFSIDTSRWSTSDVFWNGPDREPLRILHAPNHRNIKGTSFVLKTIEELKAEGKNVELVLLEKVPNDQIQKVMSTCHVVIDQLVIGWYAMFAIEAMATGRTVLCHLRKDLVDLYQFAGLLKQDEIPILDVDFKNLKDVITGLYQNPDLMKNLSARNRKYVEDHHSTASIGERFNKINLDLGLKPAGKPI